MERSAETRYRISQETGISEAVLSRFARGLTVLAGENVDRLAEYLKLELAPARTTKKAARKER